MRRFTQRNALVTLSDINLTPLLDLAWTLMIIFMIATPLLDPSIEMELPEGGRTPTRINQQDLQQVEIDVQGNYFLNGEKMSIERFETSMVEQFRQNPNLIVRIRADERGVLRNFYPVIDCLIRNSITRISLATRAEGPR